MSETNLGPKVPQQPASPAASQQSRPPQGSALPDDSGRAGPEPTMWVGWIAFAAIMRVMLGSFHMIQGLVALFHNQAYLVSNSGLVVSVDFTTWGWIQLIFGAVAIGAGAALITGKMWARVLGIGVAALSALVNIGFLGAYPIWSMTMIAFDVLVIWAITVHGAEMKTVQARRHAFD
jgi:hypothetical protein